jgi:BioD-like phosphotransacetylase family protein
MLNKKIYVAATSQHVGKTTSTLGLLHALDEKGMNVGYCKPVGQQFIDVNGSRADKDALLFSSSMAFDLLPDLHSPVILGSGATTAFLDNPKGFNYTNRVLKSSKALQQKHDVVVYEGTGHPGVGSVVNLSNAKVAELLGARLIMVVEAGVGNTIDRLDLNLSVFEQKGVQILGIIVNKCLPSKIEKVRHYVGRVLENRGINLLGVIPYEEELGLPVMHTIAQAVDAKVTYNDDMLDNRVKDIIAGSLIDLKQLNHFDGQLLVVSINRLREALRKVDQASRYLGTDSTPLSGIILTGRGDVDDDCIEYFQRHRIPVLRVKIDTYEAVIQISKIEVKINTRTPWKVKKAITLFQEHIDLDPVMAYLHDGKIPAEFSGS